MIDKNIRKLIRERAKYLCEYCHSSAIADLVGWVEARNPTPYLSFN